MAKGHERLFSKSLGADGNLNTGEIHWIHRLGPNGGSWEVVDFALNRYSPALQQRVEVFGDKNGVSERLVRFGHSA